DGALALQAAYRQASTNLLGTDKPGAPTQPAIELKSPITGVINSLPGATPGEYVPAEHTLFTVLDNAMVFIEAKVPESVLGRLGAAKSASYEWPPGSSEWANLTADGAGRLVFAGLQVDHATRTVPLVYEAENDGGRLRIGQYLNLNVETKRAEDAVAIPDSAVVEEAGQFIAFVQVSGETFQKRELKLGIRDGNFVQVLDGVKEGERVVTKGAYAIRLSSISGVIPAHGHAH
ncbi:MAG: efflux RND transporter periplasmic adaptor subunit, partial [Verrucomicrobiota bacterium]